MCGGNRVCKSSNMVAFVVQHLWSTFPIMVSSTGREVMKSGVRGSIVAFVPIKRKKGNTSRSRPCKIHPPRKHPGRNDESYAQSTHTQSGTETVGGKTWTIRVSAGFLTCSRDKSRLVWEKVVEIGIICIKLW